LLFPFSYLPLKSNISPYEEYRTFIHFKEFYTKNQPTEKENRELVTFNKSCFLFLYTKRANKHSKKQNVWKEKGIFNEKSG